MKKNWIFVFSVIFSIITAVSVSAASKLGNTVVVDSKSYSVGDASRDGKLTMRDALVILRYSAGLENFTSQYIKLMDVDGNGAANGADARAIMLHLIGLSGRETVLGSYNEVYTVKLMDETVAEKKMTTLSSVDSYTRYIDECLAEYPDAFGEMAEEVRTKYDSSYFKSGYYLVAACINNDKSNTVAPKYKGVFKDALKSELDVYSYIPLKEQNGTSSWCMFIECSKYDDRVYYPDCEINYVQECEKSFDNRTIGPLKCDGKNYIGKEIRTIDTFDEYNHYINQCGMESETQGLFDESYFAENELIAVCKPLSIGSYDVRANSLTLKGSLCSLYMHSIKPVTESEEMEYWFMLIPVAGKQWEDMEYNLHVDEVYVKGAANDIDSAIAVSEELRYGNPGDPNVIKVISSYEDYVSYIVAENQYNPKNEITGCTREFFEDNSLIVIDTYTASGMFMLEYDRIEECDGETLIHINHYSPSGPYTDDIGNWRITIPVSGKQWEEKNIRTVYTYGKYD